jgi:ATP-binding cassette subfamily B (MDR/TAP) protein 1
MLETVTRKPIIDGLSDEGIVPASPCTGAVTLVGVSFAYPARPDAQVCKDYDLTILPGETVALVGASGCGKVRGKLDPVLPKNLVQCPCNELPLELLFRQSTIVNLLLRFYDPQAGQVLLDGHDIRALNVHYLRSQIGYDSTLFPLQQSLIINLLLLLTQLFSHVPAVVWWDRNLSCSPALSGRI